jgi:hypothetical protein
MEYKITTEQILAMAKECPTAEKILKAGFPDAFKAKDEWGPLSITEFDFHGNLDGSVSLGAIKGGGLPFDVVPFKGSCTANEYKIENGKIWRRK